MSQAHITVLATLTAVLPNTWAGGELPPAPTFPALVFEIDSEPEPGWCALGTPDLHTVTVLALSPTLAEAVALRNQARAALEALPSWYDTESIYDAEYESRPDLYVQGLVLQLRMRSV